MSVQKRWMSLFVENEIGVLAKISGLFSSKLYNLDTLTVGVTEDPTVSRITISVISDDRTFEKILKQLNRSVEVIKVIDLTEKPVHAKELMFIQIRNISEEDKQEIFRIAGVFDLTILDYDKQKVIVQSVHTEDENNGIIEVLNRFFLNQIDIVRGGTVAIEALQ